MNSGEDKYLQYTLQIVKKCIDSELIHLKMRRENILEERKYFNDYFSELKDDEKKDLLENELLDTNAYAYSLQFVARLSKQLQEPYFAGFKFKEDGEEGEDYYLSIHTLRDPETGVIVTTDWRAPIAALYYDSEIGKAQFSAPAGTVCGELLSKKRYVFKKGKLIKCTEIEMPSDDEMLSDVLSQNSDTHMKTILQTIQKEQYKIIKDYIEGIAVIQGCAGSGKSSIALHKVAYVLYVFRDKLKNSEITIISPNSVFSEYISSVLPDLGESSIKELIFEDVIQNAIDSMNAMGESYKFMDRLTQQEIIMSEAQEGLGYKRLAEYKATMAFRNKVTEYVCYLRGNIFNPEELDLDGDGGRTVPAELLKDLFYSTYSDLPIMQRTRKIASYIGNRFKIKDPVVIEKLANELDFMMISTSVPVLYRMMYSKYADISDYAPTADSWEDACAVAIIYSSLYEPDLAINNFYLIADEAQDYVPIYIDLLNIIYKGSNMLFVGDNNQTIMGNKGNYIQDIKSIIKKRPFKSYELTNNYRSTKSITEYAAQYQHIPSVSQCIRTGKAPVEITVKDAESAAKKAEEYIKQIVKSGYQNCAIICKSAREAAKVETLLKVEYSVKEKINLKILPIYVAKGLEYDAVIVWDMPEDKMYTACTRAMHELFVIKKECEG